MLSSAIHSAILLTRFQTGSKLVHPIHNSLSRRGIILHLHSDRDVDRWSKHLRDLIQPEKVICRLDHPSHRQRAARCLDHNRDDQIRKCTNGDQWLVRWPIVRVAGWVWAVTIEAYAAPRGASFPSV